MKLNSITFGSILIVFACVTMPAVAQVDIGVDHYTGQAQVAIPLYVANDRSLVHPVSLVHDGSGVKVASTTGWVGQNWSLSAGGEIRRELRGIPDDYYSASAQKGWLHNTVSPQIGTYAFPADGSALNCTSNPIYEFIELSLQHKNDNEPDIFYISGAGLSGSFMFDNSGLITNIKVVPYQEIKIVPYRSTSTSPIDYFEITTPDGTKYTYSRKQTVVKKAIQDGGSRFHLMREYKQYETEVTFTSAWKLTSIRTAIGEALDFTYIDKEKTSTSPVEVFLPPVTAGPSEYKNKQYSIQETITFPILSSISSPHQSLTFLTSDDIISSDGTQLNDIDVSEIMATGPFFVKRIHFDYTHFYSLGDETYSYNRRFLVKLSYGDPCMKLQPYVFNYHGVSQTGILGISASHIGQEDIWGYYKNCSPHYPPKLYVYPSLTGINRISLFQKPGVPGEIILAGEDVLSAEITNAGVLSYVSYPSGARTYFTYQSHEFTNPITNTVMKGAGLRIASIRTHDGITYKNDIVRTFEYTDAAGVSSGKLLTLPVYWQLSACHKAQDGSLTLFGPISALTPAEQWRRLIVRTRKNLNKAFDRETTVGYARVTEKISSGKGKIVYTFDVPNTLGAAANGDWNPTFNHIARTTGCPSTGLILNGFYTPPYHEPTPYDYARGLQTRVSYYAEGEANPVRELVFNYVDKAVGGSTIKSLVYEIVPWNATAYFFTYGIRQVAANKMKVLSSQTEFIRDKTTTAAEYISTVTDYTYGTDHPFIASSTITNSDGSKVIKKNKYVKDFTYSTLASSDLQVQMIDKLHERGQTGMLIEEVSAVIPPSSPEKVTGGALFLMNNFGTPSVPVIAPKENYQLVAGAGITSFAQAYYTGSGSSRSFVKNGAYRKIAAGVYNTTGEVIRMEDSRRQVLSTHRDLLTGSKVALIQDAEPYEVVYSPFDQHTAYSFDMVNFTGEDKLALGKAGERGLKGWKNGTTKSLTKTFKKRPNTKYKFSAWYKPPVTTGTHVIRIVIKNLSNVTLAQQDVTYAVSTLNWIYAETLLNLTTSPEIDVVATVTFVGSYTAGATESSTLDEVTLSPENVEMERYTYNTAYGITSVTAPDGQITTQTFNKRGMPELMRDHDDNILSRSFYTEWAATVNNNPGYGSNVYITLPPGVSTFYEDLPYTFSGGFSCREVSTYEWKVYPVGGSGNYAQGTASLTHTFATPGSYYVALRVSHPSYGSMETSHEVNIVATPSEWISVVLCVDGPTEIDVCTNTVTGIVTCAVPPPPVNIFHTQFSVQVSGCSGGTYTYEWMQRILIVNPAVEWVKIGSASSILVSNDRSYELKCIVTSSCGSSVTSSSQTVTIHEAIPGCQHEQD